MLHSGRLQPYLQILDLDLDLPITNALAYCENSYITAVKSFITLGSYEQHSSIQFQNTTISLYLVSIMTLNITFQHMSLVSVALSTIMLSTTVFINATISIRYFDRYTFFSAGPYNNTQHSNTQRNDNQQSNTQ